MTVQEIIDRARRHLKDDIEPYRIEDNEFFDLIDDGVLEIRTRRPDLYLQTDGTFSTYTDVTAVTDTIDLPDQYKEAMSCYVSYREYLSEDADRHNSSQASLMFNRFETLIRTV